MYEGEYVEKSLCFLNKQMGREKKSDRIGEH